MGQAPPGPGPEFWSSTAIARALACCDLPVLLEEVRKAHGWTQAELAGVVGYSQSWVSKVLRGKHPLTLQQARNLAARAGIPVHLLRLGDGGREDPAKRRDFTTAAARPPGWPPAGQRYGSERVIERSRLFRRTYTGLVTGPVRNFDRQLAALLS